MYKNFIQKVNKRIKKNRNKLTKNNRLKIKLRIIKLNKYKKQGKSAEKVK